MKTKPLYYWAAYLSELERVALADALGGTRVSVPEVLEPTAKLVQAIGIDASRRLWEALGPGVIIVPLERELRASHYRALGESHAQIARRPGMTEKGVAKLCSRLKLRADRSK